MKRIALHRTHALAALFACAAGLSCGSGLHDGDEAQVTSGLVQKGGGSIDFMGARLDICDTCLADDATIKLTWHRTIAHAGAISSVYDLEVLGPGTFLQDPKITIWTTDQIAAESFNMIGSLVPSDGLWVPNTSKSEGACQPSTVCGPVQSQIFRRTNILRLAIVTECYAGEATPCPAGQSCARANACQQCPPGSPCP